MRSGVHSLTPSRSARHLSAGAAALAIAMLGASVATPAAAVDEAHGAIAGTITATTLTVDGWQEGVQVYAWNDGAWGYANAEPDGTYLIDDLPGGDYTVQFRPLHWWDPTSDAFRNANLYEEYFADAAHEADATLVSVVAGAVTHGIDASLESGSSISGTVTAPDSTDPLWYEAVTVTASIQDVPWSWTGVAHAGLASDGSYVLAPLPAGEYRITYDVHTRREPGTNAEVAVNLVGETAPEAITVDGIEEVFGADMRLEVGATISGTLTAPESPGLNWADGPRVMAYDVGTDRSTTCEIGATGTFTCDGIRPGTYALYFSADAYFDEARGAMVYTGLQSEYWNDARDFSKATLLTIAAGATVSGLHAELTKSGPVETQSFTATPTPTITGGTTAGSVLKATPGAWAPVPTLTYQWLRDGVAIAGATSTSYTVTKADRGHKVAVKVTGSKAGYFTVSKTSAAKAIPQVFTATPVPKIAGTALVGKKLTAKPGTWSPAPTLRFQWFRDGKAITGATKQTHLLTKADRGKRIVVKVTGSKSGYLSVTKASAYVKVS